MVPSGATTSSFSITSSSTMAALDVDASHCLNGNFYLHTDDGLHPYYFVLIQNTLCFVELQQEGDQRLDDDDSLAGRHEDYWGEAWYHPNCSSRETAVDIMRRRKIHGSFLVRPRAQESWALSYWYV